MLIAIRKWYVVLLFFTFTPSLYAAQSLAPSMISMDGEKIIAGTNVRIRSEPKLTATIVEKLVLGTVVHATKRTKEKQKIGSNNDYWYYLDEKKAWVFGSLLRDFNKKEQEAIHWQLVQDRLATSKLHFREYADLTGYISRILPAIKTRKILADLEWKYLISLQKAADKIPYNKTEKQPYSGFIKQHKDDLFYTEIQGQYIVPNTLYWKLSKRYSDLLAGDKITWHATNAADGGECEGDVACVFMRMMSDEGEYIHRYPQGIHIDDAIKQTSDVMDFIVKAVNEYDDAIDNERQSEIHKAGKTLNEDLKKLSSSTQEAKKLRKQLAELEKFVK